MKILYSILFLTFAISSSFAQDVRFRATANANEIALNQSFRFTITVENANVKKYKPPSFEGFEAYGPQSQSSYQMMNGSVTQSKSYTYTLKPTKEGEFVIGSAAGIIDGKAVKTNPISIKVTATKQSNAQAQQQQNTRQPQQPNSDNNTDIESQIKEGLFVRLIPDKTTIYKGQQVNLTYKVYYRMRFRDVQVSKAPAYNGFLSQEIELTDDAKQEKLEEYNGKQYTTQTFKKVALFASNSGKLTIDPMELEGEILVQRRDAFFNHPFFTTTEPYAHKFKSNTITINVKPLPANQPSTFSGGVGKYNFTVDVDKNEAEVDDPITLKIKISGDGNIKSINFKDPEIPQSFEVYDPKVKQSVSKKSYNIRGSKTYEYLLIPRAGGDYEIPPISFTYFDLSTKKYVTKQSDPIKLNIEGDATLPQNTTANGLSKEEITKLGEDIRYIKTGNIKSAKTNLYLKNPLFIVLWAVPFLALIPIVLVRNKKKDEWSDVTSMKQKRAGKEATKRLSTAKKLISSSDDKSFYDEIIRTVWNYCSDKLNIDAAQLSKENIGDVLGAKNVSETSIQKLKRLIGDCEMALFAGMKGQSKDLVYADAEQIINDIEEQLKS